MIELSIIIVNWNGRAFLPRCLQSIVENPPRISYEIVVVDNASQDDSVQWLKSAECLKLLRGTPLKLIESDSNLGFGQANNLAFEAVSSRYRFLLNPDTEVKAAAMDNLLAALDPARRVGMSVPQVVDLDGVLQRTVWYVPSAFRFLGDALRLPKIAAQLGLGKWAFPNELLGQEKREVPLASGCAMMVLDELIADVGGFDPTIFMYGEDVEWCHRIGRHGWKIIFEPSAEIVHIGGQSSAQNWGKFEARIKEEEAFLKFQQSCLSTPRHISILSVRLLLMLPNYLLGALKNNENDIVKRILLIQVGGLKRAFRKYI